MLKNNPKKEKVEKKNNLWRSKPVNERLSHALVMGITGLLFLILKKQERT